MLQVFSLVTSDCGLALRPYVAWAAYLRDSSAMHTASGGQHDGEIKAIGNEPLDRALVVDRVDTQA
jgi:hypothetical protein